MAGVSVRESNKAVLGLHRDAYSHAGNLISVRGSRKATATLLGESCKSVSRPCMRALHHTDPKDPCVHVKTSDCQL